MGHLVGSINSDRFHMPTCRHVSRNGDNEIQNGVIYSENEIWFDTAEEAFAMGDVPCRVCRPV